MNKANKQIEQLKSAKTLTWQDLVRALMALGYHPIEGSGSRVKFDNGNPSQLINLHKPHPDKLLKNYALRQVRSKLEEWGQI